MSRPSGTSRIDGLSRMLRMIDYVASHGGIGPEDLRAYLRVGIATIYRLRRGLEHLGARIRWDAHKREYHVDSWGVLDRGRVSRLLRQAIT